LTSAYELTSDQAALRSAVEEICKDFGDQYWLEHDDTGQFPEEFYRAFAEGGWLGVAMPSAYGGADLGITEASIMMECIAASGAGMSGASALHMNIFGLHPVVVFGTESQKSRWLPPLIAGEEKACFGVTEPNAGLNTLKIQTTARKQGDHYVVRGQKIWISTAQVAHKIMLLVRTSPYDEAKPTHGLSLFYTDLNRERITVREIQKLGRKAVDSNELFIDNLEIPEADLIGVEGDGFRYILHGLNPERILIASEAVGLGRTALNKGARYARERVVFDRPIGQNQGIQHPLARNWIELEAAWLLCQRAASLYDAGRPCGAEANAAKYFSAEAGFRACETAVLTHGGMGYAKEFHVERHFREAMIPRIAPVSANLIVSFIGEKVLGLAKSY
jgi:acyl-CoA dehydrogenase